MASNTIRLLDKIEWLLVTCKDFISEQKTLRVIIVEFIYRIVMHSITYLN